MGSKVPKTRIESLVKSLVYDSRVIYCIAVMMHTPDFVSLSSGCMILTLPTAGTMVII